MNPLTMTEMTPLYIDPRTVPAEPEDPRVELLAEDLEASGQCCFDIWPCDRADEWRNDARNILARLDAAGGRVVTPEMLAELRRLLDAPPQHLTIARDDVLALLDAADERDRLAGLLDEPRRSGCAVEIAGVRIAPCDERGQTADMRALDTAADRLDHMREAPDVAELRRLAEAATPGPWEVNDHRWSVLIPTSGEPSIMEFPDAEVCAHAARAIGCEWIETVSPLGLAVMEYRMLVDDIGAIVGATSNPLASWLYGTHFHESALYGSALVCKEVRTESGPALAWLTQDEAERLAVQLVELGATTRPDSYRP